MWIVVDVQQIQISPFGTFWIFFSNICDPEMAVSEGTKLADVVGWLYGPSNCVVQVPQIEIHQKLTVSQS